MIAGRLYMDTNRAAAALAMALLAVAVAGIGMLGTPSSLPGKSEEAVTEAYGKLPLTFVPNRGQTDERVRFYAQGSSRSVYFTRHAAVLSFTGKKKGVALALTPLGANPNARLEALDRAPGKVNYMIGSERHTNLPTYREIAYRDLWPGIDLVFRGDGTKLEYELHLAPGADPGKIALAYRGADGLAIGRTGKLLIDTPLGTLRDARPRTYQLVGGKKVAVDSRFALKKGKSSYGFGLGAYDRTRPLVIDPALTYSTFLGGTVADQANGIAIDSTGNAYVVGQANSSTFPTVMGSFDTSHNGDTDVFVSKLNSTGTALTYSTFLGGTGDDIGRGIAVDAGQNAYVTGSTNSTAYPTTVGALDTTLNSNDIFVTKLNSTGAALTYSTFLGGGSSDNGHAIAVDGFGAAYVAGDSLSTGFPVTAGAPDPVNLPGTFDGVVAKLNAAGSALVYATYLGGSGTDTALGIDVEVSAGVAYVTGDTDSTDLPITAGSFDTTYNGGLHDSFATKLNALGTAFVYSTYLGGGQDEHAAGITNDASGNVYATGQTFSPDWPVSAGAFDTTLGSADAYVTKLNTSGSAVVYSTFLGGSGADLGRAIAVDSSGRASVTGLTATSSFPTTPGEFDTTFNMGGSDAFVTRLSPTGAALVFSTFLGGDGADGGRGIAVDNSGNTYVTGDTNIFASTPFPTTVGAFDTSYNGSADGFVTKMGAPTTGSITVRKDAVPNDAQDFSFTAGGGLSPASFLLDDDSDVTLQNTRIFAPLSPGSGFSLAETVPAGWYQGAATCDDGSPISNISVSAGEAVVCTFTNSVLYARPGTATPLRVPLVPRYKECTAPDSTHVTPLDYPACTGPALESSVLTTSTLGRGSGFLKLKLLLGNLATPADEQDVSLRLVATDVINKSSGSDYTGKTILRMAMRITDRANGTPAVAAGTVSNASFDVPVDCVATGGVAGANCNLTTTLDAQEPGAAPEGKLELMDMLGITLLDAGPNGTIAPVIDPLGLGCPPTCGDGDEKVFLEEGVFAP